MKTRKLGNLEVSMIGLGCMPMANIYGQANQQESVQTIRKARDLGVTFFDTSDMYGWGSNEELIGNALLQDTPRDKVVIATKFGYVQQPDNSIVVKATPEYVRKACEASLRRLGTDYIDLYYLHRLDKHTPIEETMQALAQLVQEGKIRHIGLSEVSVDTIRRAHTVHPIAAVQTEYSLWSREPERHLFDTLQELNIGFVAYGPLGRGLILPQNDEPRDAADFRSRLPRFNATNQAQNNKLATLVADLAAQKEATPAQVALAWTLAKYDFVVPIPGTTKQKHLEDNLAATEITLTPQEIHFLDDHFTQKAVAGNRYSDREFAFIDQLPEQTGETDTLSGILSRPA